MGLCKKNPAKTGKDIPLCVIQSGRPVLFLACRPPFFYPTFVADSSRICGDLYGFIGGFGRFHLDESGVLIKADGKGCLDRCGEVILTEGKGYLEGGNMLCVSNYVSLERM